MRAHVVHIPTFPLHTTAPPCGSSLASAVCPCVAPLVALLFAPSTASPFVPPSPPPISLSHLHLSSRPACSDYLPPSSHPIYCLFPVAPSTLNMLSHVPPLALLLPAARGATATKTLHSSCPIFASCRPRACPLNGITPTRQCAAPPAPLSGPAATPTISRTRITVCCGVRSLLA